MKKEIYLGKGLVDPLDSKVRCAADEIWELASINNLAILGTKKRVNHDGSVQWHDLQTDNWVTIGNVRNVL